MKNLLLFQPSPLLKRVYPRAVWNFDRSQKEIYLTFDDGPISGLTEWILELLNKFEAKATFFCVGANIIKNQEVFAKIIDHGHMVGNHTMYHTKGFKSTVGDYLGEADDCKKLTGNNLFRPPYGQLKPAQYRALIKKGYKVILWDVISYDYENIAKEKCARNVLNNARNGSIVLFHDNVKAENNIRYALPLFLEKFANDGYSFKSIAS